MATNFARKKLNLLLDEIDREEITVDTVKQFWFDRWGCTYLPHSNLIGSVLRTHPRWVHMGNLKARVYRRSDLINEA